MKRPGGPETLDAVDRRALALMTIERSTLSRAAVITLAPERLKERT
jgi:hypothetical protein